MPHERVETAYGRPEASLHVVVLDASVEFKKTAVLENMHGETLGASGLSVIQATFVIVQLEIDSGSIRHVDWVVI